MNNEEKKDFIKITISGKCLNKKSFNIKLEANVDIVKRLILARIKRKNKCISPTVEKCFLIAENNIKLDNTKKIFYYYKNNILYDNCELELEIKMKTECCSKNEYEFGSINGMINNQIMAAGFNFMDVKSLVKSSVRSTSKFAAKRAAKRAVKSSKKREGWYDDLSWDDTPIDDDEWE